MEKVFLNREAVIKLVESKNLKQSKAMVPHWEDPSQAMVAIMQTNRQEGFQLEKKMEKLHYPTK